MVNIIGSGSTIFNSCLCDPFKNFIGSLGFCSLEYNPEYCSRVYRTVMDTHVEYPYIHVEEGSRFLSLKPLSIRLKLTGYLA